MYELENIETGELISGDDIEYFIDDDTSIGEIYIDGNLIFQELDSMTESQLKLAFHQSFKVIENANEFDDIFSEFNS